MSRKSPTHYHPLQVTLHWLIVILVFAALVLGKFMSRLPNDGAKLAPLAVHMSIGLLTLIVIVLRRIVRMRLPQPARAATGSVFLDRLSRVVHHGLYLFVFLMALSGLSLAIQAALVPIVFGGSGAPLPADFYDFNARFLHKFIAPSLLILVFLHIGGALYHQFLLRDRLLSRMWYAKGKA